MDSSNSTRVAWLETAWGKLREKFLPKAPETAAVTIGFPSRTPRKAIGECWGGWKEGEGFFISIHPILFPDASKILETMLHEMVHAYLEGNGGHGKRFAKECEKLGFIGNPTCNSAGPDLKILLDALAVELGPIPAGKGEFSVKDTKKKQATRMRKYTCPGCQQIIRAAKDKLKLIHSECTEEPFEQEEVPDDDGTAEGEDKNVRKD